MTQSVASYPSVNVTDGGGGGANDHQIRNATPPHEQRAGSVFIGRFNYVARTAEDLSFEKNEQLLVIGGMEGDWWMARSLVTNQEGYIPRNYVAAAETYEAEEYVMCMIMR